MQDPLDLGVTAGQKRIGSWLSTQKNWVLTTDSLALGPHADLNKLGLAARPKASELGSSSGPNSLGSAQDPLALGPAVGPKRIGSCCRIRQFWVQLPGPLSLKSWRQTQENWVLAQHQRYFGSTSVPTSLGSGPVDGPNSLGSCAWT
jgi:hypothetical protein